MPPRPPGVVEPPRFRILGPIQAGAGRRVSRGRTLSLLALLLVHRGATVHVDRALDALWERDRPRHGRKAVHVVASRLRSALGAGVLRSHGCGYALEMEPGELDADRFEGLVRRGRAELAAGEPRQAAATLGQALALWRGPALADVAEAGFAQPEIARLEDLRLACVSDRIDADLACGRHAEAVAELEALVREHPLRERLRGQQMLALYRAGRQAEALDAYRDAHEALLDGLGIEPSPDLRALDSAIARHEVPPPVAAHEPLAADARRLVTCLFAQRPDELTGRDPEWLRRVLQRYHHTAGTLCAEHDGVVVESRGDAVLAVFGAPQRAYRAATALVASGARCGIATGEVVSVGQHLVGEPVSSAERLARSAVHEEIRLDERTSLMVRRAA
jgi:DNA-binding SARP family transcriptional activator